MRERARPWPSRPFSQLGGLELIGWAARKSSRVLRAQVNQERNYSLGATWQASRGAFDLGAVSLFHIWTSPHIWLG